MARTHPRLRPLLRGLLAWPLLMVLEAVQGVVRVTLIAPLIGDFRARQVAVFSGSAIILLVASILAPWFRAGDTRSLLAIGVLWVSMTVPFEILLGRLSGADWQRIWSDFDIFSGGLLPLGLAFMLVAPLLGARLHADYPRQ
jgi:hypothetical protein